MIHTFIFFQTFGDHFSCLTDPNCSITSDRGKVPQPAVIWSCLSKIHFSSFCTDTCLPLRSCISLLVLCFFILPKSLLSLLLLFCFFFNFSSRFLVFSLFSHLTVYQCDFHSISFQPTASGFTWLSLAGLLYCSRGWLLTGIYTLLGPWLVNVNAQTVPARCWWHFAEFLVSGVKSVTRRKTAFSNTEVCCVAQEGNI